MSAKYQSRLLLFCTTLLLPIIAHAQSAVWTKLDQVRRPETPWVEPQKFKAFQLNHQAGRGALKGAPAESSTVKVTDGMIFEIPMPEGQLDRFKVVEAPVMAPELAAKFPEIKTYLGVGIDDPSAAVRFDLTPAGFHAQILSPKGAVYVDPYEKGNSALHVSYYKQDYRKGADGFQCFTTADPQTNSITLNRTELLRAGSVLRTYRLACAATGEYTAYHGGTVSAGMAAIVTAINRVVGVYEMELSIRMVLVANNNLLVYTNGNTDPYSNSSGSTMLGQNQSNIDAIIGSANYDIGHVFSTGGGGIAGLGVVCVANNKARGVTGLTAPTGDAFYIDYVAHEMGHQFGANHTFNSVTGSCGGGNRNASTAYEPGSGTTIMAYAGICGADDLQAHSDPFFHFVSFDEIINNVSGGNGSSCSVNTATGNTAPTVSAGANFTIPKSTPFTLTATGSDPDGDPLTFCWEERDLGAAQALTDADNGASPLFRSFSPTGPSRTFPKISSLLANTSSLGEKLPTTTRTMNFRVTARDNRAGGGGVNTSDMAVSVTSAAGPFVVTFPNGGQTLAASQTVTWNVAGTTASPINAAAVNILLSTDGGLTFPIVLKTNTPNDGSETVSLPNIATSTARLKIEAAGNIFFDLSDANFSLTTFTPTPEILADSISVVSEGFTPTNNAADPGETVTAAFTLRNTGTANATNVTATLLSSGGIIPAGGVQSYGTLFAGAAGKTRNFTFAATGSCGGSVTATLAVYTNGVFFGNVTKSLQLGGFGLQNFSFGNGTQIKVPVSGNSGVSSPYPSSITVAGVPGTTTKISVTLSNIVHPVPDEIDALLVGPHGENVMLMSDAGGANVLNNVTLTFDDAAATALSDGGLLTTGTYRPSNFEAVDSFTSPAPSGPYGTTLSVFNGSDPNGKWSLYVYDDGSPNKGAINGWSLTIGAAVPSCVSNPPPSPSLLVSNTGGQLTIGWSAALAATYRVQFKNDLNDISWTDVADILATNVNTSVTVPAGTGQRFYRITVP